MRYQIIETSNKGLFVVIDTLTSIPVTFFGRPMFPMNLELAQIVANVWNEI